MRIGFDTGFFIRLLQGTPAARAVWLSLEDCGNQAYIGCLTLFELEKLGMKGMIRNHQALLESLPEVCEVIWLDRRILSRAAKLGHGLGIPAVDSLILAGFLEAGVERIYTTDRHFELYRNKSVKIDRAF